MSWDNPPRGFRKQVDGDATAEVRRIVLDVLGTVTAQSPVDTGRFKGNWQVGINTPKTRPVEQLDPAGSLVVQQAMAELRNFQIGQEVWISNNLPYAQRLNAGWSSQAPANFVQMAMLKAIRR